MSKVSDDDHKRGAIGRRDLPKLDAPAHRSHGDCDVRKQAINKLKD